MVMFQIKLICAIDKTEVQSCCVCFVRADLARTVNDILGYCQPLAFPDLFDLRGGVCLETKEGTLCAMRFAAQCTQVVLQPSNMVM